MKEDAERAYVDYVTARLPVLNRAAYLLCADVHQAEDIVQSTITALYRYWPRARRADNLDGYVHRMLVRKFLDQRRLGWSRVRLMADVPETGTTPESMVETRDALRAGLARLSRAQRSVLVLRFVCDMSIDDVASALRCSVGTVKSHTSRGLTALRQAMGVPEERNETWTYKS